MSPETITEKPNRKLKLKAQNLLKLRLIDKTQYREQLSLEIGRSVEWGDKIAKMLLDLSTPNEYDDICHEIELESESVTMADIGFGRLIAIPVIFHPDCGSKINAHAMHDMLSDVFGIIEGAKLNLMANYRSLDAIENLGAGGKKQLIKSLMDSGYPSPVETLGLEKPMPQVTNRGIEALIVGYLSFEEKPEDEIPILDITPDMNKIIPFQKSVMRLENSLIDIGVPSTIAEIGTYQSVKTNWAVLRTGIQEEIEIFFDMVKEKTKNPISAVIRKNETSFVIHAMDDNKVLDIKEITPNSIPVSSKELEMLVARQVEKVRYLAPALILPKFLNYQPPTRQYMGRPYLSVVEKIQLPMEVGGKN